MPENANKLSPELAPLAEALRSLAPTSTAISRDRLLFEAGRAAAARPSWLWPGSTMLFAGLALFLAAFVVFPNPQTPTVVVRERIVEVRVPEIAKAPPVEVPSGVSPAHVAEVVQDDSGPSPEAVHMFHVRNDVLRWGVDMLPVSKIVDRPSISRNTADDLNRWLEIPPGTFAVPH
jgi:hypothetical protein